MNFVKFSKKGEKIELCQIFQKVEKIELGQIFQKVEKN